MQVGTIVKLKVPCLGNPKGTKGVVFYDYGDGSQIIFENGNYDGFSKVNTMPVNGNPTEEDYFVEQIGTHLDLCNYEFKNVIAVSRDFERGIFDDAFKPITKRD